MPLLMKLPVLAEFLIEGVSVGLIVALLVRSPEPHTKPDVQFSLIVGGVPLAEQLWAYTTWTGLYKSNNKQDALMQTEIILLA
jgi:hypothetical protein